MTDEGGVSAALLEIEDLKERKRRHPGLHARRYWPNSWLLAGAVGLFAIGGATWLFRRG